jgi:hypothetical protein
MGQRVRIIVLRSVKITEIVLFIWSAIRSVTSVPMQTLVAMISIAE